MRRQTVANQVMTELLVAGLGFFVGIQQILAQRARLTIASRPGHRPRRG